MGTAAAMARAGAASMAMLSQVALADADLKAGFIGPGTYATKDGCEKLTALAGGADRNVETVPETLTEAGFEGWEGGCTFTSFSEVEKNKIWKAKMQCAEEATEGPESDVFERMPDGTLKVTVMGNATIFQRCDVEKGQ